MKKRNLIILIVVIVILLIGSYFVYGVLRNRIYYATSGFGEMGSIDSMALGNPLTVRSSKSASFGLEYATPSVIQGESMKVMSDTNKENGSPERLVIKTGTLNMVVGNVSQSMELIKNFVEEKGGFVVSSQLTNPTEEPRGYLQVRVPAEVFDESMGKFKEYGVKITSEYVDGQDVTEEYADLETQISNLEKAEEQFLKILERSGEIADVLAVQREINNVRNQIERNKGSLKFLAQSVALSSITINLAAEESALPLVTPSNKWEPIIVAKRALRSFISFLQNVSYFIIWLFVYAVIWVPALLIVLWVIRKIKSRLKD